MKTIRESRRELPILATYDVIIVGGGPSGCAAAIAAARLGAHTLLVEKEGYLGGATTAQLVTPILSTNGMDFQGLWHDFMRAMQKRDGVAELSHQNRWCEERGAHRRWRVSSMHAETVKYAWDDLLGEAGVDQLLHALVCGAVVEENVITGIVTETRAGRQALKAQRVVDCSGDAAVCHHAGVPWEQGAHGKPWAMAVSKMARIGNLPLDPALQAGHPGQGCGRTLGPITSMRLLGMTSIQRIDPLDPWDLTRFERESRQRLWDTFAWKQKQPGFEQTYLVDTANAPGVRSSRRVHGLATVLDDDAWHLRKYPDGMARSSWEIDVHCSDEEACAGKKQDCPYGHQCRWDTPRMQRYRESVLAGDFFDIRYGALVPAGVDNLLVGGRCIAAEHMAQASLRIQQTCLSTGQAAGTAAALSLQAGRTPRTLDPMTAVAQLQADRAATEPAFALLEDR